MDKTGEVLRLTTGQVPGSRFHIGSNLVEYTAEDAAGNTAKCRFYVHVTGVYIRVGASVFVYFLLRPIISAR